jgi:sulfate-transporting ATPase
MEFTIFALIGLATGAIYALLSQGLVLIYRGSGLLNFAQGALAMFGAYAYYEFTVRLGWGKVPAVIVALLLCATLGTVIQLAVFRTMRKSSALSRVIATLGFVLILQSAAYICFGEYPLTVPSIVPSKSIALFSHGSLIGEEYFYIIGICLFLSAVMYVVYRYTSIGRVTTAVAEHEIAAASLGYSPNMVAMINWVAGSVLAGIAGILIAPLTLLEPTALPLLVIPAMAAALIAQFRSFPITLAAALVIGVIQAEIQYYVSSPGWPTAAPFLVVIAVLILRGRSLPLRSFVLDRLPAVGSGRPRLLVVALLGGVACWIALIANADWSHAIAFSAASAIVCLSVVVLTGYAGQLSLAQFVLAGVGALLAAHLAPHMPFLLALTIGASVTGIVGGLIGLPALRTRGVTLAVSTLCLGSAIVSLILTNGSLTGATQPSGGLTVPVPNIFGWSINPVFLGNRYAFVVIVILIIISLAVANLRRGVTGRKMLAVRSNERAAASLGVNVLWIKTYAFIVAAVIAAIGGILLAFMQPVIDLTNFDVFTSILIVAYVVIGGVGNIPGAYLGALLVAGGIGTQIFSGFAKINYYLPLIGGFTLLMTLVMVPDGLFEMNRSLGAKLLAPLIQRIMRGRSSKRSAAVTLTESTTATRVQPNFLRVSDVSVSFGGVQAVRGVSLEVRPGEVHGLIGPNGAGKTTLIDAISGFVRSSSGEVFLGDVNVSRWAPRRRAISGLSRSFQSLELFTDLTISENLAVSEDASPWYRCVSDFIWPGRIQLGYAASETLRSFELEHLMNQKPSEISFGQRKTVAIARAIASSPSVLLLDEPAAGLDDHEAAELATLIRRLADEWGIALLLVEHKVDMIMSVSDRITVMQNGSVLASGSPEEIRSNPDVIVAYLGESGPVPVVPGHGPVI